MQKLTIDLRHLSRIFLLLILAVVLGSSVIIYQLSISLFIKIILWAMVFIYGAWIIKPKEYEAFFHDGRQWYLSRSGQQYPSILLGSSTITTLACVLRFSLEAKKKVFSCVVFKDSINIDQYRQLLVRLRAF